MTPVWFGSSGPDVSDEAVVAGTLLPPEERSAYTDRPTHVSQDITVCVHHTNTLSCDESTVPEVLVKHMRSVKASTLDLSSDHITDLMSTL